MQSLVFTSLFPLGRQIVHIYMTIQASGEFLQEAWVMGGSMALRAVRNLSMRIMATGTGNLAVEAWGV